jgi:hypothetical protein
MRMPSNPPAQPDPHEEARDTPESIAKDFTDGHMSDSHDKDTREGIAANLAHWIRLLLREREAAAERRGAEAMRKQAASLCAALYGTSWKSESIRTLPLFVPSRFQETRDE